MDIKNKPAMLQTSVCTHVEKSSSSFLDTSNRITEIKAMSTAMTKTTIARLLNISMRVLRIPVPSVLPPVYL